MLRNGKSLKILAGCALCCLGAAGAVAGPPPGKSTGGMLGRAAGLLAAAPSRGAASRSDFQTLDLRPPETDLRAPETLPGSRPPAPIGDAQAVFPSARRAQLDMASEEANLPGGAKWATLRMENKVQEMERRVPREGLPVARLWETKTALLHVGLSPRGKPGLWLMQKVP
jgi:hypothetical protein